MTNPIPFDRTNVTDLQPLPPGSPPAMPISEQPLPLPPGTNTAAPPTPEEASSRITPSLHVTFVGMNAKDKQRHGRVIIHDLYDLRTQREVSSAEILIAKERGFDKVEILAWRTIAA